MLNNQLIRKVLQMAISISKMTSVLPLLLGPAAPGIVTTIIAFIPVFVLPTGMISGKNMVELAYGLQDFMSGKVDLMDVLQEVPGLGEMIGALGAIPSVPSIPNVGRMVGGAHPEASLSTEAIALGATVVALVAGGAIKLAVDSLIPK